MFWDKIIKRFIWIFDRQWDYQYLKKNLIDLEKKSHKLSTIFSGSSYAIFGINPSPYEVNLGLPSQDFYYSLKIIYSIIHIGVIPERIIIGTGYYSLFSDLSCSTNIDEMNRIYDVYYPLLNDPHNLKKSVLMNIDRNYGIINSILRFICNFFISITINKYFNRLTHSRDRRAIKRWNNKKNNWSNIRENERILCAEDRSFSHLKQFKYIQTYVNNRELLRTLYSFCKKNKILLGIFVAPMSKQYLCSMSSQYRDYANKVIVDYKNSSDIFIDYNEASLFDDEDFVDPDHLSDSGAIKLTNFVKQDFYGYL